MVFQLYTTLNMLFCYVELNNFITIDEVYKHFVETCCK